jgi:hypothetical protein
VVDPYEDKLLMVWAYLATAMSLLVAIPGLICMPPIDMQLRSFLKLCADTDDTFGSAFMVLDKEEHLQIHIDKDLSNSTVSDHTTLEPASWWRCPDLRPGCSRHCGPKP